VTPAPTTTIDDGIDLKFRMPSDSDHAFLVELDPGRSSRCGARGYHDVLAAQRDVLAAIGAFHQHRVLVDEAALAGVELDAVALELPPDHVDFSIDDALGSDMQIRPRDPVFTR
jgi:hypothetical protein